MEVPRTGQLARLPLATIVRRQDVTADLFVLWLKPDTPFSFASGQYITIGTNGIERPYSIASAPYEPLIELFIERVAPEQGGRLTPVLHALKVDDTLTMRPRARGRFAWQPRVTNHVMVATVTGIAPYVSMIRQFVHDHADSGFAGHRFFVMHGASYRDEFTYDAELRVLSERYSDTIHYLGSVSRPSDPRNAGWSGATGRINLLVEDHLARWSLPVADTVVYLCGNPGMIDDVEARLAPKGWSVVMEQYWRKK